MTLAAGVGERFAGTVTDGPLLLAAVIAALAGLISFLSPCVLPLVPGYLSYVTGLAGTDAARRRTGSGVGSTDAAGPVAGPAAAARPAHTGDVAVRDRTSTARGRVLLGAGMFVLGFTAVFVALGAFFGGLGSTLYRHELGIQRFLGVVVVVLGLGFLGVIPGMQRELRIHRLPPAGLVGAPLLGAAFGLGWTPCLGPTLGAVQTLAYDSASAGRGALLSVAYCLGLGVPFLLVGSGVRWLVGASAAVRRHARWVTWAGGALLVALGVLLLTGLWDGLTLQLRSAFGGTGLGTTL